MEQFVINIGRQLGSGGRTVGEIIARRLGVKLYDKELINLAARESGICPEFFEKADEKESRGVISTVVGYLRAPFVGDDGGVTNVLSNDALFKIQSDVIRAVAARESAVFVGRCADYVLRERKDLLNVFIHAPLSFRAERAQRVYEKQANNMEEFVRKKDKKRASFYNYFSQNKWGDARHYHLAISSVYGVDFAVEVLKHAALSFPEGVGE